MVQVALVHPSEVQVGLVAPEGIQRLMRRVVGHHRASQLLIGGEMVPHGRVEESLLEVLERLDPGAQQDLAVTAREDAKKGERLVVVHTPLPVPATDLVDGLASGDLPPLFRPRAADFLEVAELPRLATGKLDLVSLKRLAAEG